MVAGMVHGDFLPDIRGTLEAASRIRLLRRSTTFPRGVPTQSEMIQLVRGSSGTLPHSQTETAAGRIAPGIHDFRSIAVPLDESRVEQRPIRWVEGEWVA